MVLRLETTAEKCKAERNMFFEGTKNSGLEWSHSSQIMFMGRYVVQIPLVRNETLSNSIFYSVLEWGNYFGSQSILNQPSNFLKAHLGLFWGSV